MDQFREAAAAFAERRVCRGELALSVYLRQCLAGELPAPNAAFVVDQVQELEMRLSSKGLEAAGVARVKDHGEQ